jgi:hypothetical protein
MDLKFSGGELAIEGGDLVLLDGSDAIRQHLECRLRFVRGEWFLDQNAGVPYFEEIFGRHQVSSVAAIFSKEIRDTPHISELVDLTPRFDGVTRKLSISLRAIDDTRQVIDLQVSGV